MTFFATVLVTAAIVVAAESSGNASPIQRVQGVVTEVGEGFLLLRPDGQESRMKFILRWKARFVPPKVPFAGDRVLILYKDKEEGAVIYEVDYLQSSPAASSGTQPARKEQAP